MAGFVKVADAGDDMLFFYYRCPDLRPSLVLPCCRCKKSADGEVQYLDFPNTTASYHSYRVREIFHDIKMTTIEVAPADAEYVDRISGIPPPFLDL